MIELLIEIPATDTLAAVVPKIMSSELLYTEVPVAPEPEPEHVLEFQARTGTSNMGTYAIKGFNPSLPVQPTTVFDSLDEFIAAIKPTKNGERVQLVYDDSIKIIIGRFIQGEWVWTGLEQKV